MVARPVLEAARDRLEAQVEAAGRDSRESGRCGDASQAREGTGSMIWDDFSGGWMASKATTSPQMSLPFEAVALPKRRRKVSRRSTRGESQEAPCLDEPYEPRERSVIHAELRALAELHLAADLDWFRARFPEVFQ